MTLKPIHQKKKGDYLTIHKCFGTVFYAVYSYANNLYKVDEFRFCKKKGVGGWYERDSEWGYMGRDVDYWTELPKPPITKND